MSTVDALAAVAVAGAASAQVSLSGKLAYGYETAKDSAGVTTKGLRVTDGNFTLKATEDLGGGLTAGASMDVQSRGRGTDIAGRDASLYVAGGFGKVMIGAIEAGNGILGIGGAGAPTIGLDNNKVLSGASNVDILGYSTSLGNGISLSASLTDSTGTGGDYTQATTVGVGYGEGAIAAKLDMTTGKNGLKRTRMAASYDLGMAKVGFGYEKKDLNDVYDAAAVTALELKDPATGYAAGAKKQMLFGVNVPMGAVNLGLNYGRQKQGDATNKGTDLGVSYSLSKRTTVYAQYQSVKIDGKAKAETTTRVKLMHSF